MFDDRSGPSGSVRPRTRSVLWPGSPALRRCAKWLGNAPVSSLPLPTDCTRHTAGSQLMSLTAARRAAGPSPAQPSPRSACRGGGRGGRGGRAVPAGGRRAGPGRAVAERRAARRSALLCPALRAPRRARRCRPVRVAASPHLHQQEPAQPPLPYDRPAVRDPRPASVRFCQSDHSAATATQQHLFAMSVGSWYSRGCRLRPTDGARRRWRSARATSAAAVRYQTHLRAR